LEVKGHQEPFAQRAARIGVAGLLSATDRGYPQIPAVSGTHLARARELIPALGAGNACARRDIADGRNDIPLPCRVTGDANTLPSEAFIESDSRNIFSHDVEYESDSNFIGICCCCAD